MSTRHKESLYAALFAIACILLVDFFTNEIGGTRTHADFRNYQLLFEEGLGAEGLQAPYAYRYVPAYLAKGISAISGSDMLTSFAWLTRISLFLFLFGLHFLVKSVGGALRSSLFVIAVVAGSFCHLKFLLFDPTRPDALGFLLTLLAYMALRKQHFAYLLLFTLIGSQVREFTLIPFALWLVQKLRSRAFSWQLLLGAVLVAAAVLLPRGLIEVSANLQFVPFDLSGPYKFLHRVLLDGPRLLNILFVLIAYTLPFLLLWAFTGFKKMNWQIRIWLGYALWVLVLLFLGGTDLARFAAYLFIPLAVLLALNSNQLSVLGMVLVVAAVFWFNKVALVIPFDDKEAYLDFYGGVNNRINLASLFRWEQMAALCILFFLLGLGAKKIPAVAGR